MSGRSARRVTIFVGAFGFGAALALFACGSRTGLLIDEAPPETSDGAPTDRRLVRDTFVPIVDAEIPPPVDAQPVCPPIDAGSASKDCSLPLRAGSIFASMPGCYVDVQVMSNEIGSLAYACDGGPAVATFGSTQFPGAVLGGNVEICFGTKFHYSDGCDWESAQSILGSLASKNLAFSYVEQPVPGQHNCASPCSATGTIFVQ